MTTVGRWSPNKVRKRILDGTWVASSDDFPSNGGLAVMVPSSVAVTGGGSSASVGTFGGVTFTSAATISLNGVFTSEFDNYMIMIRGSASTGVNLEGRLRVSGTDASGSDYVHQYLDANDATLSSGRSAAGTKFRFAGLSATQRSGYTMFAYGPNLTQPTAFSSISADDYLSAYISDWTATHSLSTSYDGLTIIPTTGTVTGLVVVYGLGN